MGTGWTGKAWRSDGPILMVPSLLTQQIPDPHWAHPIKTQVRQSNQARAVNEVMNALKRSQGAYGELHVVNGVSTNTSSSLLTTAAKENYITPYNIDGLPGKSGFSTGRLNGPRSHPQIQENEVLGPVDPVQAQVEPPPPRPINPSLSTLEKAVAARIFFENLYFPLFRHPPSREQRRLAMERDMAEMQLTHDQKEHLRARWRQNESDYLRERRQKVDVSAFIGLKIIGHGVPSPIFCLTFSHRVGAFGVVSLVREKSTGNLYAMKQVWK